MPSSSEMRYLEAIKNMFDGGMVRRKKTPVLTSQKPPSLDRLAAKVRSAQSWAEIEDIFTSEGYRLFPGETDVYGINFDLNQIIFLSDCGHFFDFIVERLGQPPIQLMPKIYSVQN